jgi:hypothetical protein
MGEWDHGGDDGYQFFSRCMCRTASITAAVSPEPRWKLTAIIAAIVISWNSPSGVPLEADFQ